MSKIGDEYQELVAAVVKALDPGATVKIGEWVKGPDGQRDMDVSVRGSIDNSPHLTLIECKDWKRPVGIGAIDALESKRHDLGANLAILYSNSGFTKQALRKARRTGIEVASALASGNKGIRVGVFRNLIAKGLSVDTWHFIFFAEDATYTPPLDLKANEFTYQGLPVVNWIHRVSLQLLSVYENKTIIRPIYAFHGSKEFQIAGEIVKLRGLGFVLKCRKKWLSQEVQVDVTLGLFNHLTKQVIVPDKQGYVLGTIDNEKWQETDERWTDDLELGTFELRMTLFKLFKRIEGAGIPAIDGLILEQEIKTIP